MTDPLAKLDHFIAVMKGEQFERRRDGRIKAQQRCQILYGEQATVMQCFIVDLSESGARLRPTNAAWLPRRFQVQLDANLTVDCSVTHRSDDEIGVAFIF